MADRSAQVTWQGDLKSGNGEIHEAPSVGSRGTSPLVVGDVVTVEPGIYDPAIGGVRLEDMLVITTDGSRNLTRAPRKLVV